MWDQELQQAWAVPTQHRQKGSLKLKCPNGKPLPHGQPRPTLTEAFGRSCTDT